jgi:hypothetical protein
MMIMKGVFLMKKIVLITFVVISSMLMSSMAFAMLLGEGGTSSTTFGGGIYKPSSKVSVCVVSITTAYVAGSVHTSSIGNPAGKSYATINSSPAIPEVIAPAAAPACATAGTLPTGFTP